MNDLVSYFHEKIWKTVEIMKDVFINFLKDFLL